MTFRSKVYGVRALALELRLFEDLVGEIMARRREIAAAAVALAALDLAASHAECAAECGWEATAGVTCT